MDLRMLLLYRNLLSPAILNVIFFSLIPAAALERKRACSRLRPLFGMKDLGEEGRIIKGLPGYG